MLPLLQEHILRKYEDISMLFTINTHEIALAIKKLFGIKRFANIEFSARHAFENLDVAMILLQFFLIFLTVLIALKGFIYFFAHCRKKKLKRMIILISHMRCSLSVSMEKNRLQSASLKQTEIAQKQAYDYLQVLMKKRSVQKRLGLHYPLFVVGINFMQHHMPAQSEHIDVADSLIKILNGLIQ